jgi:hypothetical protein
VAAEHTADADWSSRDWRVELTATGIPVVYSYLLDAATGQYRDTGEDAQKRTPDNGGYACGVADSSSRYEGTRDGL